MTAATRQPLVIGLTGGIGAGKSTVAGILGTLDMVVVDVDAIGRQVLEPAGAAQDRVIAHFGPDVVAEDGSIDRRALAAIVFGDAASGRSGRLDELEAISHPAITETLAALIRGADPSRPIVLDMAVLADSRLGWVDGAALYRRVVVVEADLEVRLERLVARGMDIDDARARIAVQPDDSMRRRVADVVVRNDHDVDALTDRLHDLVPTIEAWASQMHDGPRPSVRSAERGSYGAPAGPI
jgi:dephospho-CoA kinase